MIPVVLIATDRRLEITTRNVRSLINQTVKPIIVIVCSNQNEVKHYNSLGCKTTFWANNPLGAKWQHGVNFAKSFNPDILIITGSDDILSETFVEQSIGLINQGNDFIGIRAYWQHRDKKAFYCKYTASNNMPLGGGRVYSSNFLKWADYKIFDTSKKTRLDDLGWDRIRKSGFKYTVLENPEKHGMEIHAIKGNWAMLNPFTIKHKNIELVKVEPASKVLPFFYANEYPSEVANSFGNV